MENNEKQTFRYTYSAKEQEEVRQIRQKYAAPEADKMEQLRALDRSVTNKGTTAALIVGILGALVLGTGMSLIMTDLATYIGYPYAIIIGVVLGAIGLLGVAVAYPLYNRITAKERAKIAPEILRLTDELMK